MQLYTAVVFTPEQEVYNSTRRGDVVDNLRLDGTCSVRASINAIDRRLYPVPMNLAAAYSGTIECLDDLHGTAVPEKRRRSCLCGAGGRKDMPTTPGISTNKCASLTPSSTCQTCGCTASPGKSLGSCSTACLCTFSPSRECSREP